MQRNCAFLRSSCIVLACLFASACQSSGGVIERRDEVTGLSIVTNPRPMTFARAENRLSRSARDYVFLGPVEIGEHGVSEYFLWVALASTIDRAYLHETTASADIIYIDLDGEPLAFELEPWAERLPGLSGLRIYAPAVKPAAVLAARITRDQLVLLARENIGNIRIAQGGQPSREYSLWNASRPWPEFARYADARR